MKLGCNYWASNAGTEMWKHFDTEVIRNDLKVLCDNGVTYLRVFPNWRDFQPVEALTTAGSRFKEYRLTGARLPQNKYYLDEEMVARFAEFCDICHEYGMKLIVGLLTGWMSGRVFVPPVLDGKKLSSDPECLYFEQLYIEGLVESLKDKPAIYAWDHGNECLCMDHPENFVTAENWMRVISNAVYSHDRSRPLISGINFLDLEGEWRIAGQADVCDMLVTHPYPFWGKHTKNDRMDYIKTTLYGAAASKLYSDIGHKPCMIEEFGTMGPSVCSEDFAAKFLRVSYFSALANGSDGLLWWCANEQTELMTPPYTWTMVENELGMRYADGSPKPVLREMGRLAKLDITLPEANCDAVCLLTKSQDDWGIAYMTYVLSKQAGLNISFADASAEIPDAKAYMLPSITGDLVMPKEKYIELMKKVYEGAKLYISNDGGILARFEELTGNRILDSEYCPVSGMVSVNGKEIPYSANQRLYMDNIRSEQLGTPLITKASYGKGTVYFTDIPVEAMLLDKNRAFDNDTFEIYRMIFKEELDSRLVKVGNRDVALTLHESEGKVTAVMVNHSNKAVKLDIETKLKPIRVIYGDSDNCAALDAVIIEYSK